MRSVLPRTLPRVRNSFNRIVEHVALHARGGDRTRMPFCGQGILSPSSSPNRRQQRGDATLSGGTDAHLNLAQRYHGCYHRSRA